MDKEAIDTAIEETLVAALENPPKTREEFEALDRVVRLAQHYIEK